MILKRGAGGTLKKEIRMTKTRILAAVMGFLSLAVLSFVGTPASAAPVSTGTMATSQHSAEAVPQVTTVRHYRRHYYRRTVYRRPVYVRRVYGRRYYRRY
jgi:hypothetical protein